MFARRKYHIRLIAIAAVFAALTGAFFDEHVAHAQAGDNDYVDVALILEVPDYIQASLTHELNIIVVNNGSRTAYDVKVVVDVVYPKSLSHFDSAPDVPVGSASLGTIPDGTTDARLSWTIPALGGLQREEVTAEVLHESAEAPIYDNSSSVHEFLGKVTTQSFEKSLHKGNNTSRVWSYNYLPDDDSFIQAGGNNTVNVSVDKPSPSAGETVNFTITAGIINPYDQADFIHRPRTPPPIDQKVVIELSGGLTVGSTDMISYAPDGTSNLTYSNGVFNIGTRGAREQSDVTAITHSVTLPISVSSDAVVNEQCLTATLTGNPPPGTNQPLDDDISDNVAKLCLGTQPLSPLQGSQVDLFNIYPCVGNTNPPCDSTDDVRVRAVKTSGAVEEILGPGRALIQIQDRPNRKYDSHTNSVNSGDVVSWQIPVKWSPSEIKTVHTQWNNLRDGFTASGTSGGAPPGKVHIRAFEDETFEIIYKMTSATGWTGEDTVGYNPGGGDTPSLFTAEFEKLGIYKLTYKAKLTRATLDGDEDCDPNTADPPVNQRFCASETYTFVVGPIAELAVEDGGVSSHVAADRNALAIVAVNNGPDALPGGARVTGLPTGAEVLRISHGSYDSNAGEWNITELKSGDYYRSAGMSEPTLVLGASDGDTASVSIASTKNYEICVGSDGNNLAHTTKETCEAVSGASWHTVAMYDPKSGNNSATITARAGTGGVGEGIPELDTPSVHSPAVGFEWDEVEYLYGAPVKHYEIQWSSTGTDGWSNLNEEIQVTVSVDSDIEAGETRYYRIRAVNQAGEDGPWSAPQSVMVEEEIMATAGAPGKPVLTAAPNDPNRREEILVSWTKPVENGSPIVSYTLEVSDTGRDNSWSDSGATLDGSATSWTHSGLTGGTRKFYRFLATNLCDAIDPALECDSLWSDTVNATTDPPGQSGPPINVAAAPDGDTAIDISWDEPLDDGGSPIRYYEVQWSADGTGGWQNAGRTPDAETRTFKHSGLSFGTTRHYRVAARNDVMLGVWSDPPVSTTTLAGVPGMPNLTVRTTDANTIELTWTVPADNGSPILHYELDWSPDGSDGSWDPLFSPSETETSYSDGDLDPGTERHYRIRAVNGADPGEGSWSAVRSAKTPPAVPNAPTLRADANGQNAIDLLWEPPFYDGGAEISGYELHVSTDGTDNSYSRLTSLSATARSHTHSGLQPGDERYYQLRARNSAGWGEFSQTASAMTLPGVPAAPNLTAQANGASEIKLSWTKPDDRGSEILVYQLQQSDDGNDWSDLDSSIAVSDTEYAHTGLSGGTTKHYRIRAFNGNGDGEWSATRSARTDAGGPDAPVLTLTVIDENRIDLSWTVPADNGSSISGYWVERSVDGDHPWERLTSSNRTTGYSDTTLYRGMTRYYRVAAFNGAGTGSYSAAKAAATTGNPATAPGTPRLFRLSEVSRNQVTIAWEPPEDDGGAPVTGYEYETAVPCEDDPNTDENESESNCGFTEEDIKDTAGTSATISGLNTDGDYAFQVRAVNVVGKGEWVQGALVTLRPSTSAQVRVSPTTITVNEGATVTYTISLSTEPLHPVEAWIQLQPQGDGGYSDLEEAAFAFNQSLLVPNGWTHPDPDEVEFWKEFSYNWSQGVKVTFTAPEDSDADDEVAVMSHFVSYFPYDHYQPCRQEVQAEREQCEQDWEDAWADSPYRFLTGASVIVTVKDND